MIERDFQATLPSACKPIGDAGMNSMQVALLTLVAAALMLPVQAKAQVSQLVEAASDRFFDECSSAINAPLEYITEARNAPPSARIELNTNDEGGLYYVHDTNPPGESTVQFGQATPNRLRLFCGVAVYNNPLLMDSVATQEALERYLNSRDDLRSVGGKIEMQDPIAGASSETGTMMYPVADIYRHLITGWSDANHIAQVVIQINMYGIWTEISMTQNLTLAE